MKLTIVTGATSAGKTGIALEAAKTLGNVEIISADAFQVYIGFDVGTAKASLEERASIPHYLIDTNEPSQAYTAGLFAEEAERLAEDIMNRGKIPLIVGGTGLYIKTLTDGIFDCPEVDASIRPGLQERYDKEGLWKLYAELKEKDSVYASRISENDPVRVIRALEVCDGLGISFTEAHKKYHKPPKYSYRVFAPKLERAVLYGGINERTRNMWKEGWPEEVKGLLEKGVSEDCPAFRAIGYKAVATFLRGDIGEAQTVEKIAQETRHFAKRQTTWFNSMKDIMFYDDKKAIVLDIIKSMEGTGDEV